MALRRWAVPQTHPQHWAIPYIIGESTAACTGYKMGLQDLRSQKGEKMEDVHNWKSNQ